MHTRLTWIATILAIASPAQMDDAARRSYDALVKKQHVGGRITPEERQSMMKVFPQIHPARDQYGMAALTDLGAGAYKGEQGGLYPGGANTIPPDHLRAGLEQARQVIPLDADGRPSPNGKIALMSIGMSNTTMEYQTFMKMAAQDKELNPRLVLVDGAQGGQSALETSDTKSNYWNVVEQRMAAAGVTARQVQAVWMFQVVVTPNRPFPLDARRLQHLMVDTLRVANDRFPNLKIAYLSSRIYAGYALVPQNPEPHSYESGFAPKWIIADQIAGYLEFNYDPARGRVRFPWVAWGPYMWADGVKGRKDGLTWVREDFGADGMHPSNSGREKVAKMLLQFLKKDPTSTPWFLAQAQPAPNLDANSIRQKVQRGEQLTAEERQFVERSRQNPQSSQQMQQRRAQYLKEHPPQSSLGLIPLTDLGSGVYKGEEGGLYTGGRNEPPEQHVQAGVKLARQIAPLDPNGEKSADGKIVLLSIGFSNPSIEFPAFQKRISEDADVNPRLVTVNGCVGSQAASVIGDPGSAYWNTVDQRLSAAGVTRKQVQAVWIKEVNPGPSQPFPVESKKLYNNLISTLHILHDRFPNLKVAYLSSRTYGGYTELGGSPEPWAYETGFSVKWVVVDQLASKPELNYDPAKGAVRSPWIAWGPYLWTDGVKGRKDGFVYLREDLREDGLHPSDKGSAKIASLMMNFFKSDPTTRIWFLKAGHIQYGYGPMDWVEPDRAPVEGTEYKTFRSKTINADVNYLVYLPPDYEQKKSARFPVLYELPASGQTTKGGAEIVRRVDRGIRAGRILPMIVILVNGLRGNTMYCDSRDGRYPLETVIVKDLVPHVDATYRTIASREGRGLDGFSMGGFGAAHLGFKYPELFGVLSIMAPPLLGPELKQPRPTQAWSRLFSTAMAGDMEYFRANDPFTLVEKNADKLRDRTVIRIVAHMEEEQWLWPQCEKLHKLLVKHMVQHEFLFLTNVKSHNRTQCLNTMGDSAVAFFSSSLVRPRSSGR